MNADKVSVLDSLTEITMVSLREKITIPSYVTRVKIIGTKTKTLVAKIKDESITTSGNK